MIQNHIKIGKCFEMLENLIIFFKNIEKGKIK